MKNFLGGILIMVSLLAPASRVMAQEYSYLYIQGDKITPFYVKMNGEMQARYGKNYCVVPKLKAGPVEIEILFQQNAYPPQTYAIQIPENGAKGYLLNKQGATYALYDLDTKNYLQPVKQ